MERLKIESGKISALQAADVVKNSKEQKDKTIEEAEAEYMERLKYAAQLRVDGTEESQKLADKVVGAAEYQYKEAVRNAEAMHEDIVAEAKLQAKEHIEQVDWETGEIKTKWQVLKEKLAEWHKERNEKANEAEEKHREKMSKLWDKITVEIPEKAKDLKDKIVQKWEERNEELKKKEDEHRKDMEEAWSKLKEDAGTWASNMMDTFVQGIENKRDAVKNAVAGVADRIKGFLGFASPTEEGPLSDSDKWMPSFMDMIADGIKKNKEKVTKETDDLAKRIEASMSAINNHVTTTVSIIEKEFTLWKLQNQDLVNSSKEVELQIELQRQKHELLTEQIKVTEKAMADIIAKYGEGSIEALKYKETLLDLKIAQEGLTSEIEKTTKALEDQAQAQIKVLNDGAVSVGNVVYGKGTGKSKKDKDMEAHGDEIIAVAERQGVDMSTGYSMWQSNKLAEIMDKIPKYALGGYHMGGYAWVGEEGPELIELPAAKIHSNRESKDIVSRQREGIKQTVNIYSPTPLSPSEMARKQLQASRQLAMEWGV